MSTRPLLPLLLAVLLEGCAGAGLAAMGPLFSTIQMVSDRSVERTLPADRHATWMATLDTLGRMAVRVSESDRTGESWVLRGTGETVTVHGELSRVTPALTRLSLRVEAGRILADKQTAEQILTQVAASLAAQEATRGPVGGADDRDDALAGLQRQIERLNAKLDEATRTERPPAESPTTGVPSAPGGGSISLSAGASVLVVPASVGLPLAQGPAGGPTTPETPTDPERAVPSDAPSAYARPPARTEGQAEGGIMTVPLVPVDVLQPVGALSVRGSSQ